MSRLRMRCCGSAHRRIISRYFGSTKICILWIAAAALTVYILNSHLFFGDKLSEGFDQNVIKMSAGMTGVCGRPEMLCEHGQYSYYIRAGLDSDGLPTICFNGKIVISPESRIGRNGIHIVVINETSGVIIETRVFDMSYDDTALHRYFRLGIEGYPILLIATADDISFRLTSESRKILQLCGSEAIGRLSYRDSFVMVGQYGLKTPAKAIEKLNSKTDIQAYGDVAEIQGCFTIPMGEVTPVAAYIKNITLTEGPALYGRDMPNCGMSKACPEDSASVYLYSGRVHVDGPEICFNGRQIIASGDRAMNIGRGINVLTVDPSSWSVVSFARFDTYASAKESEALVEHMKNLKVDHITLMMTHDDSQSSLSTEAKEIVTSMGSSFFSKLSFRDVWLMVGQPKMKGFTTIEEIDFFTSGTWPIPLRKTFCLSKKLKAVTAQQTLIDKKKSPIRTFCKMYEGFDELCAPGSIDAYMVPVPLTDSTLAGNDIFSVPIIIIAGLDHLSTYQQLKALLAIPGINVKYMMIMYDEKFVETGAIADKFQVHKFPLRSSTSYISLVAKALEETWNQFPKADYAIILEEQVIPSTDFLAFMAQCFPIVKKDKSLVGISAWNENGFTNSSGQADVVYRGRIMPGMGVLLRKSFYVNHMVKNISTCCLKRSWYGWFSDDLSSSDMIYPDVSRVMYEKVPVFTENQDFVNVYFRRPRLTSSGGVVELSNAKTLTDVEVYDKSLEEIITTGLAVDTDKADDCLDGRGLGFVLPVGTEKNTFVIYYEQKDEKDESILVHLCRCFGLFSLNGYHIRGVHKSTLRFTYQNNRSVIFVGSMSPFYTHKPPAISPVKVKT